MGTPSSSIYKNPRTLLTKSLLSIAGCAIAAAALGLAADLSACPAAAAALPPVALTIGHLPPAVYSSPARGATDPSKPLQIELALKPRHAAELSDLLTRLKDPKDPAYGRYITPDQYRAEFGRTSSELNQIFAYAQRHNLSVVEVKKNNLFVRLSGSVADINKTFGITLKNYASTHQLTLGRIFHAPDREPTVDSDVAPLIGSIVGLDNAAVAHNDSISTGTPVPSIAPNYKALQKMRAAAKTAGGPVSGEQSFSYTGNEGLSPYDTLNIYNLLENTIGNTEVDGAGQVIACAEEGTFTQDDISEFEQYYDIGNGSVPTLNVYSVDGYDTDPNDNTPGEAAGETTLDIDMLLTDAYGASQIQIYESNDNAGSQNAQVVDFTDAFADMANASTRPNVISVSYGFNEDQESQSDQYAEGEALDQLALQGQTVVVSSGDSAAFADESNDSPNVLDPGSQPTVVCVGGTLLNDEQTTDPDGDTVEGYVSESSWFDSKDTQRGSLGTGSGGGISAFWDLPFFQEGSFDTSVNTQGSTTMRNTPDVSLFGDFDDGSYDIYLTNYPKETQGWTGLNGTSAACPLWAGILADVNQFRKKAGVPLLGEADPDIYTVAESSDYSKDFHDIKDNSTNGYFKAVTGYDNSTGWGTPNNTLQLIQDLANAPTYIEWSLSASATSVTSGKTLTGTITIPLPASKNQTYTLTSSNTSAFTVPSSVTIDKGDSSATFTITSKTVTSATKATLTASYYGYSESGTITVNPAATSGPGLKSVLISPTSTVGGSAATTANRVYLTGDATANTTVSLKSSNTSVATVPSTLTIDSGSSSHTFTITTKAVTASTNVTITATLNGTTETGTLTVTPATAAGLKSVTLDPTSTVGGSAATTANRVYWNGNAPANETVTLKSSNTSVATVPSSVSISSGSSSHAFTITTKAVTSSTNVTITATSGGVSKTATLTVTPASTAVAASKVSLSPSSVTGGANSTGTVTLTTKAPSGGTVVTLKTSNTSSSNVPSSVTVAAGATTATFTVKTASVFSDTTVTISATAGGVTKTATLTINS